MARTDSEKISAKLLNVIRREWGISAGGDETTAQAQLRALEPLAKWLREGADSPKVVIRAVQLLLADPELSGVDQRPAIETVIHQVSDLWANAGMEAQGMMGLQAMLLAAWPHDLTTGGFALPSLFDSVWEVQNGRTRQRAQINVWRLLLSRPTLEEDSVQDVDFDVPTVNVESTEITLPEPSNLQQYAGHHSYFSTFGEQLIGVLQEYKAAITTLNARANSSFEALSESITTLVNQIEPVLTTSLNRSRAMSNLLWWGQSRYSHAARRPYRRIENATERLWWMAWEASDLSRDLAVAPAASFLVETLYQLDGRSDEQKRPLKDWLGELVTTLRKLHQSGQHAEALAMSVTLQDLAEVDALGLPVTWARLEAEHSKGQDSDITERAREALAIDLDAPISRADWATWIFRESLLDRHLHDDEQTEE